MATINVTISKKYVDKDFYNNPLNTASYTIQQSSVSVPNIDTNIFLQKNGDKTGYIWDLPFINSSDNVIMSIDTSILTLGSSYIDKINFHFGDISAPVAHFSTESGYTFSTYPTTIGSLKMAGKDTLTTGDGGGTLTLGNQYFNDLYLRGQTLNFHFGDYSAPNASFSAESGYTFYSFPTTISSLKMSGKYTLTTDDGGGTLTLGNQYFNDLNLRGQILNFHFGDISAPVAHFSTESGYTFSNYPTTIASLKMSGKYTLTTGDGGGSLTLGDQYFNDLYLKGDNINISTFKITPTDVADVKYLCFKSPDTSVVFDIANNIFDINTPLNLYNNLYFSSTLYGIYAGGNRIMRATASNTFVGVDAGLVNAGSHNVMVGYKAGDANNSNYNVMIGSYAGNVNNGERNIFIGPFAGNGNNGSGNIFIGYYAGDTEFGDNKLYINNGSEDEPLIGGVFAENIINRTVELNAKTIKLNGIIENTTSKSLYYDISTKTISYGDVSSGSTGGTMTYPSAGIPISTGSAWGTSITNNSTNWNTAYTHSQDNSQAHSDYLINNGDDTTSGIITASGFISPNTVTIGKTTQNTTYKLDVYGNSQIEAGYLKILAQNHTFWSYLDTNQLYCIGAPLYLNYSSSSNVLIAGGGGNVGINTTSANFKLDVSGSTRIGGVGECLYFDTTGVDAANQISTIENYKMQLYCGRGTTSKIILSDSGDVQLYYGTNKKLETTSTGIAVTGVITSYRITNSNNVAIGSTDLTGAKLRVQDTGTQLTLNYSDTIKSGFLCNSNGDLQIITFNGSTYRNILLGVNINNVDCKIGVGNPSPTYKLDVSGSARIGGVGECLYFDTTGVGASNFISTVNNYQMQLYCGRGTSSKIILSDSGDVQLYYGTSKKLETTSTGVAITGGLTANGLLYINNAGSGTGTLGPQNTGWFHFNTDRANYYFDKGAAFDGNVKPYTNNARTNGESSYRWSNVYSVLGNFSGAVTCSSTVTATNFILSSDRSLKQNIKPLNSKSIDVEYKQFEMKNDPNQLRYGVIAQDLEITHPELVRTDEKGIKSVAYIDLLIYEISNLKERIKELEKLIR